MASFVLELFIVSCIVIRRTHYDIDSVTGSLSQSLSSGCVTNTHESMLLYNHASDIVVVPGAYLSRSEMPLS